MEATNFDGLISEIECNLPLRNIASCRQQPSFGLFCFLNILELLHHRQRNLHNASHPSRNVLLVDLLRLQTVDAQQRAHSALYEEDG